MSVQVVHVSMEIASMVSITTRATVIREIQASIVNLVRRVIYLFRLLFIDKCEMKTGDNFPVQLTPLYVYTPHTDFLL